MKKIRSNNMVLAQSVDFANKNFNHKKDKLEEDILKGLEKINDWKQDDDEVQTDGFNENFLKRRENRRMDSLMKAVDGGVSSGFSFRESLTDMFTRGSIAKRATMAVKRAEFKSEEIEETKEENEDEGTNFDQAFGDQEDADNMMSVDYDVLELKDKEGPMAEFNKKATE